MGWFLMKNISLIVVVLVITVLLSITVFSQLTPLVDRIKDINQVTSNINLEQESVCTTTFYDEVQDVYGDCIEYRSYNHCLNTSGPNTDCSFIKNEPLTYNCITAQKTVQRNKTECIPDNKFIISIDKGIAVLKKQIDGT